MSNKLLWFTAVYTPESKLSGKTSHLLTITWDGRLLRSKFGVLLLFPANYFNCMSAETVKWKTFLDSWEEFSNLLWVHYIKFKNQLLVWRRWLCLQEPLSHLCKHQQHLPAMMLLSDFSYAAALILVHTSALGGYHGVSCQQQGSKFRHPNLKLKI